jgi:hypothetical protein
MAELDGPETFNDFKNKQLEEGKEGGRIVKSEGSKELKSRDKKRIITDINQSNKQILIYYRDAGCFGTRRTLQRGQLRDY